MAVSATFRTVGLQTPKPIWSCCNSQKLAIGRQNTLIAIAAVKLLSKNCFMKVLVYNDSTQKLFPALPSCKNIWKTMTSNRRMLKKSVIICTGPGSINATGCCSQFIVIRNKAMRWYWSLSKTTFTKIRVFYARLAVSMKIKFQSSSIPMKSSDKALVLY